jgi:hypothetical protein
MLNTRKRLPCERLRSNGVVFTSSWPFGGKWAFLPLGCSRGNPGARSEWTAAWAPLSRHTPGSERHRDLFRLANKESMRNREYESLLNAVVGQ